jgi:hypothetical protein
MSHGKRSPFDEQAKKAVDQASLELLKQTQADAQAGGGKVTSPGKYTQGLEELLEAFHMLNQNFSEQLHCAALGMFGYRDDVSPCAGRNHVYGLTP